MLCIVKVDPQTAKWSFIKKDILFCKSHHLVPDLPSDLSYLPVSKPIMMK